MGETSPPTPSVDWPRWHVIASLLGRPLLLKIRNAIAEFGFRDLFLITLFAGLPAVAFVIGLARVLLPVGAAEFLLCGVVIVLLTLVLAREWYLRRAELYKSEHYVVLVLLALLTSMTAGLLNFVVFRVDGQAFLIDKQLRDRTIAHFRGVMGASVAQEYRVIDLCEKLISEFTTTNTEAYPLVRVQGLLPSVFTYDYALTSPRTGTKLYFESMEHLAVGMPPIVSWTVQADVGGRRTPLFIPDDSDFSHSSPNPPAIRTARLIDNLKQERAWEEYQVARAERAAANAEAQAYPVTLFLYQSAVETFGSSPKYFMPVSITASAISVVFACARYVYFGLFITLLTEMALSRKHLIT